MGLAQGLQLMNTKGALVVPGVRLNKSRARIIMKMIRDYNIHLAEINEGSEEEQDFIAAMTWVSNKIWKQYSQFELYR